MKTRNFGVPARQVVASLALVIMISLAMPGAAQSPSLYHAGDIAVINAIIYNNGLRWEKAPADSSSALPKDWNQLRWSNDANDKRITALDLKAKSLSGVLDVSGLSELQYLVCSDNQLSSLNVSGLMNLMHIECGNNQLWAIDVSQLPELYILRCQNNQLTSIDVSGLEHLKELWCENNQLTALNVSGCTNLYTLVCYNNQLTTLDVSEQSRLEFLLCGNNQLRSLNVSGPRSFAELSCHDNHLTVLDLKDCRSIMELYPNPQTLSLTLRWNPATRQYEAPIALNDPSGLSFWLKYSEGKLIAKWKFASSTKFIVKTGHYDDTMSGVIRLRYER